MDINVCCCFGGNLQLLLYTEEKNKLKIKKNSINIKFNQRKEFKKKNQTPDVWIKTYKTDVVACYIIVDEHDLRGESIFKKQL